MFSYNKLFDIIKTNHYVELYGIINPINNGGIRIKTCPECGEILGDSVELCFKCYYNFQLKRKITKNEREEKQQKQAEIERQKAETELQKAEIE